MASRSYDRVDFYRRNRDYSSLLEDGVLEDKEEEVDDKSRKYRKSAAEEESRAKRERQDFIERKEKLKELERIKLNQKYNGVYGMKTEHIKNENQIGRYAENISGNDKKRKMPHDNYGSFFGPSKPVIARRVIEEAKARIEKAHVAPKVSKEAPQPKKSSMTTTNTKAEHKKKPVIVNETTKKARQLKAARDYSFLFSEDAEIPGSERVQASETKNITSSRPNNVQAKQMIANNSIIKKPPLSSKPISQIKEVKSMGSSSRQMTNKLDTHKKSVDSRKQLTKVVSSGQLSRGNGSNHHSEANVKTVGSATVSSDRKKLPLNSGSRVIKAEHRQSLVKPEQRSSVSHLTSGQKTFPLKVPTPRPQADQRKSVALPKSVPPKPAPKLVPKPAPKLVPKPALKLVPKSAPTLVPKSAPKPAPKPALKPVPKMAPKVQAKPPSRDLHHERPKKRSRDYVSDEDIDEGTNFRSLIRQMFRYDPNKYRDIDDDDSDMEVGFSRIQAEERRSARIAREEDERELALIEAEEREERAKAKRRKLQQNQR